MATNNNWLKRLLGIALMLVYTSSSQAVLVETVPPLPGYASSFFTPRVYVSSPLSACQAAANLLPWPGVTGYLGGRSGAAFYEASCLYISPNSGWPEYLGVVFSRMECPPAVPSFWYNSITNECSRNVEICHLPRVSNGSRCVLPPGVPEPFKNISKPDTCAGTNPCNAGTGNMNRPGFRGGRLV